MSTTLSPVDFRTATATMQSALDKFQQTQTLNRTQQHLSMTSAIQLRTLLQEMATLVADREQLQSLPRAQRRGYIDLYCLVKSTEMDFRLFD